MNDKHSLIMFSKSFFNAERSKNGDRSIFAVSMIDFESLKSFSLKIGRDSGKNSPPSSAIPFLSTSSMLEAKSLPLVLMYFIF